MTHPTGNQPTHKQDPNTQRPNKKDTTQGPARGREDHQGRPQQRDDLPKHRERTKVADDQHEHDDPAATRRTDVEGSDPDEPM